VSAVGIINSSGTWTGFVRDPGGFSLAFGGADGVTLTSEADGADRRTELLAAAMAYYAEAFDAPPVEFEATQADLAALVGWLAVRERDAPRRSRLEEALDAIDDGLAGDVVVARLSAASSGGEPKTNEQVDPLDLLVSRYRALIAPSG
jgi:hypothetical protein